MSVERCGRCGKSLTCGMMSPTPCWCAQWPAVLPLMEGQGCLCRECLSQKVNEAIAAWLAAHPVPEPVPVRYHTSGFVEGVDYYIESGNLVFTEWSHRKRGACCGNGCRHCAWRAKRGLG